jgi:hypothetical protein
MARCVPWFHLPQGRSKVRQILEGAIEVLVTLYNGGMNDCDG